MTTARPARLRQLILIEDDDALRRSLQLLLTGRDYEVLAFSRAEAAIEFPAALSAPLLITDYVLPRCNGVEALRLLREKGWSGRALLMTAFDTQRLRDLALKMGFDAVLPKPFRTTDLIEFLGDRPAGHDAELAPA